MIILFILVLSLLLIYFFYTKDGTIIEKSIKFTRHKPYNNNRITYAYTHNLDNDITFKNIFKKHKVDAKLVYFYNNMFKTMDKFELIYGIDKNTNVSKIYITTEFNNMIYGVEKRNDKYSMRYYKGVEHFKKSELDTFIGIDKSSLFYTLFNIKDETTVYKKYDQTHNYILNSYHFSIDSYKINDYKSQIKSLLSNYKCNIETIDKWLNTYKNHYIYWIGITKKDDIEITIYYRKEKET
jgi:hypothetical protein